MERTHTPVRFQDALSSCKTSSRSSVTTKNGLGASHQVDASPPESTAIVQSDVRGGSSIPRGRPTTPAWSASTPQCAFKSPSSVEKLAHGAQLPPNRAWRLAPSGPKSTRNDCDNLIRCTERLHHALGKAETQAWSARTSQCAFKSASPVEKLAHGD